MHTAKVFAVLAAAMLLQSCRIEMPSLIHIISNYVPNALEHPNMYNFSTSKAVTLQGGFKDTLILGDPWEWHASLMHNVLTRWRIPEESILLFGDFGFSAGDGNEGLRLLISGDYEELRKATRVVALPMSPPFTEPVDVPRVLRTNTLFALAADNMDDYHEGDRDFYNINHVAWSHRNPEVDQMFKIYYQAILDVYNTGKVIAATSARVTEAGEVKPFEHVVQCGDIKESCFTMIPEQTTSSTSTRLAAMSFYLAQFYATPEEIIDVLKECAIDVGEPGVDREYGRGVVNLLCPRVLHKELEIVGKHLEREATKEMFTGGDLVGTWEAKETDLQVHIPQVLRETVETTYTGTVTGTLAFTEETVQADISLQASIAAHFLLPLKAKAEDVIKTEGIYTTEDHQVTFPEGRVFTYHATDDSLSLTRHLSLTDILRLLPGHFGSMAEQHGKELLSDPVAITLRFRKARIPGDFDNNEVIDFADFLLFIQAFGSVRGDAVFNERMDLVPDDMINFADFIIFIENFGNYVG